MSNIIPIDVITERILLIRDNKVMLDRDLAYLYGVQTKVLNQAVRRNSQRFPEDFMFQLSKEEADSLRSQSVTLKRGQHSKYLPNAFTVHGVTMLSSVLKSEKAIEINIQIVRAFVRMRKMLSENQVLQKAIDGLEKRVSKNERKIHIAINAIVEVLQSTEPTNAKKGRIPSPK